MSKANWVWTIKSCVSSKCRLKSEGSCAAGDSELLKRTPRSFSSFLGTTTPKRPQSLLRAMRHNSYLKNWVNSATRTNRAKKCSQLLESPQNRKTPKKCTWTTNLCDTQGNGPAPTNMDVGAQSCRMEVSTKVTGFKTRRTAMVVMCTLTETFTLGTGKTTS